MNENKFRKYPNINHAFLRQQGASITKTLKNF